MADDDEHQAHGGGGLGRKLGPLPMWAWAVLAGGSLGLVWFLRRGKADTATADSAAGGSGEDVPTSLVPMDQGLSEQQYQNLLDAIKKLQGPASTTLPAPVDHKPTPPTQTHHPGPPKPPNGGSHHPKVVITKRWTRHHTPWQSTLWGIAHHEHVRGGWQYLQKINHMHGDPKTHLKPGMKIKLSK